MDFDENGSRAKTETMKWSCGIIEDLDVDGITQTYATDKKTFRHEVFVWKSARRAEQFGSDERMQGAGVGAKKSKPFETVVRCNSRGLFLSSNCSCIEITKIVAICLQFKIKSNGPCHM